MFDPSVKLELPSIETFLLRHRQWSWQTFGDPVKRAEHFNMPDTSGNRIAGVLDHIRKELTEIEEKPADIPEWFDVVHLAIDGYLRVGGSIPEFMVGLYAKQRVNFNRNWPDWKKSTPGKAAEHIRGYQD